MADTTLSPAPELKPITERPTLRRYIGDLRRRREYLTAVPLSDLRVEHLDTVLGNLWFLVNPAMQSGVYFLVFGVLLEVDRGVENYPLYLVTGVLVFRLFTQTATAGMRSMRRNETLMRSLYFPRAIVPLSSAISNFYMFLPGISLIVVLAFATGEKPAWRWLALPVVLIYAFVFVAGCALICARLGHRFPDLENAMPHLLRLAFYGSGVLYAPEAFTSNDAALLIFDLNPMYQLMSMARWSLMAHPAPSWFWLTAPATALTTFVLGFVFFWQKELSYGSRR